MDQPTDLVTITVRQMFHPDRLVAIIGTKEAEILQLKTQVAELSMKLGTNAAQLGMQVEALEGEVSRLNSMLDNVRTSIPGTVLPDTEGVCNGHCDG